MVFQDAFESADAIVLAADILDVDIGNLRDEDAYILSRLATLGAEDLKLINARIFPMKYLSDPVEQRQ